MDDRLEDAASATGAISTVSTSSYPSKAYLETFYLGAEIPSRLDRVQAEWAVNRSELVRFLLRQSLDAVDKGTIAPPTETVTRAVLDETP